MTAYFCRAGLLSRVRRREETELFEHQEPVEHQVERDMLAVAVAEHVDIVHCDFAAAGRNVAGRVVQDAVVGSGEGGLSCPGNRPLDRRQARGGWCVTLVAGLKSGLYRTTTSDSAMGITVLVRGLGRSVCLVPTTWQDRRCDAHGPDCDP